jgi:hypothetical protein
MRSAIHQRLASPALALAALVGLILSGLVVGYEPVGGDPDRLYRPLKVELARALREGRLPFWSDRFGLGVPLLAESHVAALYPPNLVLYRWLDPAMAYRLAMWTHYLMLALATYAYARQLGLEPWGRAVGAVAFTFCGFQAIHSSHEPFYHALAYLPLGLLLAERYLVEGGLIKIVLLALVFGAQLTLGHFQLQFWTAMLVLGTAFWRAAIDRWPWRRVLGVAVALGWGTAMASVQLALTWELARIVGFTNRGLANLSFFSFPPAHWVEPALPRFFASLRGGPEDPYWFEQQTTGYEACFYVGTIPLILAVIGLVAGRDRALAPWKILIPVTLALATMPRWWLKGYGELMKLPGPGYFRAPGRYTLLTSLALSLLAGRGLDRAISARRFRIGVLLALAFAGAAALWGWQWATHSKLHESLPPGSLAYRLGWSAVSWALALIVLSAWRLGRLKGWAVLGVASVELGVLYYLGTTVWGWAIHLPAESPALSCLAKTPGVVRVAGYLDNLPVPAGLTPAFPYLGFTPPPPHRPLEVPSKYRRWAADPIGARWLRRYGVTHAVWDGPVDLRGRAMLYQGPDLALDRLVYKPPGAPAHATWYVVTQPNPFPPARAALRVRLAPDESTLLANLAATARPEDVWYVVAERPPNTHGPRARAARVVSYDGRAAVVEHDGVCDLVIQRTFYPGWTARLDGGPPQPVFKADGGLQAVRLPGSGTTRVTFAYHPTGLRPTTIVAATALAGALLALAAQAALLNRGPRGPYH